MILLFRDNSVSYFAKQSIVDCGENFKDIPELKDIKPPTDDLDEEFISYIMEKEEKKQSYKKNYITIDDNNSSGEKKHKNSSYKKKKFKSLK